MGSEYRLDYCGTKLRQEIIDPEGNVISLEELIARLNEPNRYPMQWFSFKDEQTPEDLEDGWFDPGEDGIEEFVCAHEIPLPSRHYAYTWNESKEKHEIVGYGSTEEEAEELLTCTD